MRRVVKIVGMVLSAFVLIAVFLPLSLTLVLELPVVQNYAAARAAAWASEKLGTRVAIGHVDIGLFYRASVEGFLVEDFQKDTLLYVERLDARLSSLGVLDKQGLRFASARLRGGRFCLRQDSTGTLNIKAVVARLTDPNKPPKGNFRLRIDRIQTERLDFVLEQQHRDPTYGVDYGDMHLNGIRALLTGFEVHGSAVRMRIDRLAFRERSGFDVSRLSAGRLEVDQGLVRLDKVQIRTPRSTIDMPLFSLTAKGWDPYKNFIDSVRMDAAVERSRLSSADVAFFAPQLRNWGVMLSDIEAEVHGPIADLRCSIASARAGDRTRLSVDSLCMAGLPAIERTRFHVEGLKLRTDASEADALVSAITEKALPGSAYIQRAGALDIAGRFDGTFQDFSAASVVKTDAGTVEAQAASRAHTIKGALKAHEFDLGRLLNTTAIGRVTLDTHAEGTLQNARVGGTVARLDFNHYSYSAIALDGHLTEDHFEGRITARDRNLRFDFRGLLDLARRMPRYDFTLDLQYANLRALHINRRDSLSELSALIRARARGRTADDLDGIITMRKAVYRYNARRIEADSLSIVGRNDPTHKYIALRTPYVDATYQGTTSYRELLAYLRQRGRNYIPPLYSASEWAAPVRDTLQLGDGASELTLATKHASAELTGAILEGLQVADSTYLNVRVNPRTDALRLALRSDYIERAGFLATRLAVDARNAGDSLVMSASTEDLFLGKFHLSQASIRGGARDNRLGISIQAADTASKTRARIGLHAAFLRQTGRQTVISIADQSYVARGTQRWTIASEGIVLNPGRVDVRAFRMARGGQELLLDGVASRTPQDTIRLSLHNFSLAPFSNFLSTWGYRVDGRSNGYARMSSALREGRLEADIALDSLSLNDFKIPALHLRSRWNGAARRVGMVVQQQSSGDTLIRGFYAPTERIYRARATLRRVDMAALDPLLKGVLQRSAGQADADVSIEGRDGRTQIEGRVDVRGFATTIAYTQVRYTLPDTSLTFADNHLRLVNSPVYDRARNRGMLSLDLDLNSLSNLAYKVEVHPERMLVLNTTARDNDLFYGRLFATGSATITGDKAGTRMNISARTDDDSEFYMPLASKSTAKKADFVRFVARTDRSDTTNFLSRKKWIFEQRQRGSKTAAESQIDITLALDVRPNALFQLVIDPTVGDIIKGRGEGRLNLHVAPARGVFEMQGNYTLSEGDYLFTLPAPPINKRFTINPGSTIQWTGSPVDAQLDISAVYHLRASLQPLLASSGDVATRQDLRTSVPVECAIHLGGRLTAPDVTFHVDVPSSTPETRALINAALTDDMTRQFTYLVFFGGFAPENLMSGASGLSAATASATGIELISNQLMNWLSTDQYRITLNYHPADDQQMRSDEVDFGFTTNLVNNRLLIEFEGNYLIDGRAATTASEGRNPSNFMGAAHVTWLLDPSGALRLRAFTQTIDSYDENQGLQKTGIGLQYKEDFNGFSDLRARIKNRFKRKKTTKK